MSRHPSIAKPSGGAPGVSATESGSTGEGTGRQREESEQGVGGRAE